MVRVNRVRKRELLRGWMKWALLPMIFFTVLFFDAWLNIQMRYKDYEVSALSEKKFALESQLSEQESRLAQFRGKGLQSDEADALGLRRPEINQFHPVKHREVQKRIPLMHMEGFETARTAPNITSVNLANTTPAENLEILSAPIEGGLVVAAEDPSAAAPALIVKNENPLPSDSDNRAEDMPHADPDLDFFSVEDMMTSL